MWTVTLISPSGPTLTAHACTRAEARSWARHYRAPGELVTITPTRTQEHT